MRTLDWKHLTLPASSKAQTLLWWDFQWMPNIAGSARHECKHVFITSYNHQTTIFISMQTVPDDSPTSEMYSSMQYDRSLFVTGKLTVLNQFGGCKVTFKNREGDEVGQNSPDGEGRGSNKPLIGMGLNVNGCAHFDYRIWSNDPHWTQKSPGNRWTGCRKESKRSSSVVIASAQCPDELVWVETFSLAKHRILQDIIPCVERKN